MNSGLQAVLGASGGIGNAVVLESVARGAQVRAVNRAGDAAVPAGPHTLNYLGDCARGSVVLGERDEADGHAWHLPAAPTLTGRGFMGLVNEVSDAIATTVAAMRARRAVSR